MALLYAEEISVEWQTIETAPKDGEIILFGGGRTAIGTWFDEFNKLVLSSDGHSSALGYSMGHKVQPTHWMPLPAPPLGV